MRMRMQTLMLMTDTDADTAAYTEMIWTRPGFWRKSWRVRICMEGVYLLGCGEGHGVGGGVGGVEDHIEDMCKTEAAV